MLGLGQLILPKMSVLLFCAWKTPSHPSQSNLNVTFTMQPLREKRREYYEDTDSRKDEASLGENDSCSFWNLLGCKVIELL